MELRSNRIAFYPLASYEGGLGHLFRCLVLARIAADRGWIPHFVLPDYEPAVLAVARMQYTTTFARPGFDPKDACALVAAEKIGIWINDRLGSDPAMNKAIQAGGARLVCIDDPGEGAEGSDLLVSSLPCFAGSAVSVRKRLAGLEYVVVDPTIIQWRRERYGDKLAVSFGGTDDHNLTTLVAEVLKRHGRAATLFLGPGFQQHEELQPFADHFEIVSNVLSLPYALSSFDLAVTAGGVTLFEAQALGIPCIVIAAEEWELVNAKTVLRYGGAVLAGYRHQFEESALTATVDVRAMSRAALGAIDGLGGYRVADAIEDL